LNMNTGWQGAAAPDMTGEGMGTGRPGMPPGMAKPGSGKALGGELVTMLKAGVESGDVDRGIPEEIGRMVEMGAGIDELMDALKQAAEKGRVSPLLLVKAEELLGTGPGADEPVDRNQVLSRSRNKLNF
jgi:hypothetical protein